MVAVPVRFECPGQWQFVSDVELTTDQSLKLKRIVTVQNIIHVMYRPSVLLHNCISLVSEMSQNEIFGICMLTKCSLYEMAETLTGSKSHNSACIAVHEFLHPNSKDRWRGTQLVL